MKHSTRHYLSQTSLVAKIITLLLVLCSVFAFAGQIVSIVITKADSAAQSTLTPGTANLTADGTSTQLLTVTVKDANGNNMTSGAADIAITKSSGTGTISSVTDNGNGTYTAIITSPTAIGSGIFVATLAGEAVKGGTDSQTEVTVTYSAGTATKLIIQTQPGGSSSGGLLGTQPVVRIADANGNTVTTSTASVSVTPSTGSTLGGTTPVVAVNGIATFTNLTLAGTAGTNYTLSFTSSGLTSTTSGNVTVTAGAASQIAVNAGNNQSATAGSAVSTAPSVIVKDASNNPVSGVSVTFANGTGGSVSGTMTSTTGVDGIATFAGVWTLGTTAGPNNTLTATSTGLPSSPVTFTATGNVGVATKGVLTTQPGGAVNGVALTTQPVVQLQDANGNNVSTSGVDVVATITSGAGTLSGTATVATNSSGVATFTNLSIAGTAGNFVLTFTPTSLTAAASNSFALTEGSLDHFAISSISSPQTAGTAITGITLTAQDVNNKTVTGFTSTVTYSGTAGITGTSSTFTLGVLSGVSVTPTSAGTSRTLVVTGSSKEGTATFTVTAGTASKVVIEFANNDTGGAIPLNSEVISGSSFTVYAIIRDASNNFVANVPATWTLTNKTGVVNEDLIVAVDNRSAVFNSKLAGIATFNVVSTSGGFTAATGTVTVLADSPFKLSFTTQPSASTVSGVSFATQPVVTVQDASGNTVTSATDSITLTLTTGTGSLGGTATMPAVAGVADFTGKGLNINLVGADKVLTATATDRTSATTSAFAITVGSASKVAITRASAGTASGAAFTTQPQVTIQDAAGNTMTSASDVVTASISSGGSLVGTVTATASTGVATFSTLGISGTAGASYTITYTGSGFTATQPVTIPAALLVIGQEYQGGIIAYILQAGQSIGYIKDGTVATYNYDANVQHGLIAATADPITTGIQWAVSTPINYQTATVPGSTSTAFGTGARNTTAIVLQNVAGSTYAAGLARAYTGGGYTDWYLPSIVELKHLYTNLCSVNNVGGFAADFYWSSSEYTALRAWGQNFSNGVQPFTYKTNAYRVRAVRAF